MDFVFDNKWKIIVFVFLCIACLMSCGVNDNDEIAVIQSPTGTISTITEPGFYLSPFCKVRTYKKVVAVSFNSDEDNNTASADIEAISVRFLDTSQGIASGIARFRLPLTSEKIKSLDKDFGSLNSLIDSLLKPHTSECVKNSARIITVEEHYSGGAGQMSSDFADQLQHGVFLVDQVIDTSSRPMTDADGVDPILKTRQRVTVSKKLNDGVLVRNGNPLLEYGLIVVDAKVQDVDYEEKVDERLARQKEAAANEALSRQQLKEEQQKAETAKATGEKMIAEARALAEQEKIKKVIKAEEEKEIAIIASSQMVATAKLEREQQSEILAKEKLVADGIRVLASARKEGDRNVLDPKYVFEKTLEADIQMNKDRSAAVATVKFPSVFIAGSGDEKSGQNDLANMFMQLMTIRTAEELATKKQSQSQPATP